MAVQVPNVVNTQYATSHKALPRLDMRPTILYARVQCASGDVPNMGKRLR